jgi:SAM-dependent MidA family methyltransferase
VAAQVVQALEESGTTTVVEFGAGTGALADQLLSAASERIARYWIIDLSGTLRAQQQERLARWGDRVQWLNAWPEALEAVVVANELLDALPVRLLHWDGEAWWERGVAWSASAPEGWIWKDVPTTARPPVDGVVPTPGQDGAMAWAQRFLPGTVTEIHPQAEAFVATLAQRLRKGAAFFLDYGFPEREYYHPQRTGGTLMCHRGHRADADPLEAVGLKDITAHVNFTGIALAGQDAGLQVLGYTSQAHFLINCGITVAMETMDPWARGRAALLLHEHEMGELFKVIGFVAGGSFEALGFTQGDRSHML